MLMIVMRIILARIRFCRTWSSLSQFNHCLPLCGSVHLCVLCPDLVWLRFNLVCLNVGTVCADITELDSKHLIVFMWLQLVTVVTTLCCWYSGTRRCCMSYDALFLSVRSSGCQVMMSSVCHQLDLSYLIHTSGWRLKQMSFLNSLLQDVGRILSSNQPLVKQLWDMTALCVLQHHTDMYSRKIKVNLTKTRITGQNLDDGDDSDLESGYKNIYTEL